MDDGEAAPIRTNRAHTLLIRCWFDEEGAALRGTLRDLAGGEHRTFAEFDHLVALLRLALAGRLADPPAPRLSS